jgi:hypothetical protein
MRLLRVSQTERKLVGEKTSISETCNVKNRDTTRVVEKKTRVLIGGGSKNLG